MAFSKGPAAWLSLSVLSFFSLGSVFFVGVFASGKDLDETCAAAGQELDADYRHLNRAERLQFFPLHNKCNADYDTVPFWVNPSLAILAILVLLFLALSIAAAIARWTSRKATA